MTEETELHRYLYTVARIVPNPAVGEFINYAVLVIDPETGIGHIRQTLNDKHALRLAQPSDIQAMKEHLARVFDGRRAVFETDLQKLRADHRNIVQYSQILPVLGVDLVAAVDLVFKNVIVEDD